MISHIHEHELLHVYTFYVIPLTVRNKSVQYACLMLISAIHIIAHFTNELVRYLEKRFKMDKSIIFLFLK